MSARKLILLSTVLLAACGQNAGQQANNGAVTAADNAAATSSSVTDENAAATATTNELEVANQSTVPLNEPTAEGPLGTLPAAGSALRFVGLWATTKANCTDKPWRFSDVSLHTPEGQVCTFSRVGKVPGGYDVVGSCTGKLGPERNLIKLRFAESARAMLLEANSLPTTGLIYCGK